MIVRERPGLLQIFFIFRTSILSRIYPQVVFIMALSLAVVWAHGAVPSLVPAFNGVPFALLGVALSVFLGFRNNACYDRWWEARKQWGHLVACMRDLARQTVLLEGRGERAAAARRRILYLAAAFGYALVDHLRRGAGEADVRRILPETDRSAYDSASNRPGFLLLKIGGELAGLRGGDAVCAVEYGLLDATLAQMNGVLAACERLRTTPVPFGYSLLLLRTAYIFCFLVPFGFADVLGLATPFAAAVFAYTFFGLDALGDELEDPFGTLPNGLPIQALAATMEIGLKEALDDPDRPSPPEPSDHVLM